MAEGETEKEYATRKAIERLRERFQELTTTLKESPESPSDASLRFCQEFCQILVEHAGRWKAEEEPLPLLEVYTVAILSYAKAITCLSSECENVPLVLENLGLSCVELLLSLPESVPGALWEEFQSCVKSAHSLLQKHGNTQLHMLSAMAQEPGVWTNTTLSSILSNEMPEIDRVHEFLQIEGPTLLSMRIKHLIKQNRAEKAAVLAKMCSEYPEYEGKGNFKQTYLVCLCMTKTQEQLMQEIMQVDCKDGLEMICNLESDGDEKGALCLCSAFLERQLLQGDVYCAWELTLFWSKLLMRSESSADAFLGQCRKLVLLSRSVCHILFLIKVIQSEVGEVGLPVCIEMCIQALQMASSDNTDSRTTICKTISCLLPTDFEVKRACQLTEFLFQPTVDSYYAVEALYNEPDEKLEDENLPVPNSLRCELLLALKTQWPFDPEFWDWRTLKRNCLALMGEEGSIVSSIDTLNDADEGLEDDAAEKGPEFKDLEDFILNTTNELNEIADEKEKNREAKKLREKGFVSARFRNWRAYMQYCVLCDKEFLGHRIVRHAQKHFKDGVYTCPICADSFDTKEILEPHVASHVKQSCKERLAAMKATRKLPKPTQSTSSHCNNFKDGAVVKLEAETIVSPNDAHSLDGNCNSAETVKVSPPKPVQTKGCFVFKPSAKKRRKTPTVEDYFTHGCEDTENSKLRFRNCQTLWEKMKADTELLQDELNRKILDSLLAFIRKSVSTFQRGTDDWASGMRAHEIPTAALVLGVNVPDHDMTFQCLSDQLQQSVTPFVVSVQATECTALNHMLQRVLERLMGTSVSVDNEEEPEQCSTNVNQKRVHCSLITLCNWYKTVTKKAASGTASKKRTSVGKDMQQHPPIVVIFKDLEAFTPKVLQDFILICSRYVEQLPLMFVFGIATSPSTIQHMLPHSVSSLLGIELFQSLSCTQHLASVIDKVILTSQFPFKPNGKVLQVLVSIFLYHDFSVRNFIKGLQLALLEHFHSQPLSVLCCKKEAALVHATELSHRDVERLQQLPSFMRYVEEQGPQEQVELLTSDDHVKEVCQKLLKDLCKYHKNYYTTLRCLHILTASLPKYPLGKQIRELHISCLEKNVWENDEYVCAMQLLRMMAKDELTSALQKCAEILKSGKTKKMRAALLQLDNLLSKFDQPGDLVENAAGEDLTSPGKGLQKKTDLFQLQKTLLEMKKSRRTKEMSQFEIFRDQALEFIDSLVRSHLAPPESQPLYEVCYYSSSAVLRRHLNATPRTSIQTALSNPYHYLKNEDLRAEDGTVSNAAPDICIVYKLHLECGRLINLYDWLEAYATVVSAAEGKDPDSVDFGKVDELKHARFIQAVSELEFLGFIKSTKQKTDHVSRLTWGGC
uniref:C2H2-type domain-containing protein n=1 Tax=Oncorhynchus kisutch TaxID=8019 RepID=A0A8C7CJ29_ONCKI